MASEVRFNFHARFEIFQILLGSGILAFGVPGSRRSGPIFMAIGGGGVWCHGLRFLSSCPARARKHLGSGILPSGGAFIGCISMASKGGWHDAMDRASLFHVQLVIF